MITWLSWRCSYYIIVIVSQWILYCHTSIEPTHKLFVFFSTMVASTIFPHHIRDSSSFSNSEVLNMFVA